MSDSEIFSLIVWIISIVVAGAIGDVKGRTFTGLLLGILLGVIGVIIIALVPPSRDRRAEDEYRRQYDAWLAWHASHRPISWGPPNPKDRQG